MHTCRGLLRALGFSPKPYRSLVRGALQHPCFPQGSANTQHSPAASWGSVLWHEHPKRHLEEESSQPANRQEGTSMSEQAEEQERGAHRWFLTLKEGAAPAGRGSRNQDLHKPPVQRPVYALPLHKKMPQRKVMGLMPTRNALSHPTALSLPAREGTLHSLSPKPHGCLSKSNCSFGRRFSWGRLWI